MKLLITGSSGFIGKYLFNSMNESKPFDNFLDSEDDITNLESLVNASKECDGIINLAAVGRVSDCEDNPKNCININVNGTINIIDAAVKNNIKWVGIVSTGEIKWVENHDIQSFKRIDNTYGISKLTSELLLASICKKVGLKATIFRISSVVFGEGDNPKKVFPLFLNKAINGEDIEIKDSKYELDFIHVNDVVDKIKKSIFLDIESKEHLNEVDIYSGVKLDLLSLAKIMHFLASSNSRIYINNSCINKVTEIEFQNLIIERKIPKTFLNKISGLITSTLTLNHKN